MELAHARRTPYGLVHVGLHERAPRGAPLALGAPFGVVARAAAPGALHHRKTMLPAQFVGRFAHRAVAGGVSVEAPAVGEGHRVDHEVVVEVGLVQMGGHHNLEAAAPQLLGEGDAHLVGRGGVGLAGRERLVSVEGHDAARLAVLALGRVHLFQRRGGQAVDAGHVQLPLGLAGVGGVEDGGAHALPLVGRAFGLVRVPGVPEHARQAPFDLPNRRDGHLIASFPAL